jgi:hypothetical protein
MAVCRNVSASQTSLMRAPNNQMKIRFASTMLETLEIEMSNNTAASRPSR